MICIPLGKIPVPTPGTPVPITAAMILAAAITAGACPAGATAAPLGVNGLCHKIEAWADTADNAATYVKSATGGAKIAPLPAPASGHAEHWHEAHPGNLINPLAFAVDAATATQGPIVTLWVD